MAKVVFILGAGASRSTGVPVMEDFLDRAHELLFTGGKVDHLDFERVFKIIAGLQILHAKSKTDLRNVESIFNLIEMAQLVRRLPGVPSEELKLAAAAIRRLLAQTIEQSCRFPIDERETVPAQSYLTLATWLRNHVEPDKPPPWAFITFNYDIALDYALYWKQLKTDYGLQQGKPDPSAVALLKLHGSLNWTKCGCGEAIAVYPFENLFRDLSKTSQEFRYAPVSDYLVHARHCDKVPDGLPAIVPPSWNKTQYQRTFERVWERAASELAQAENIIVIGYSLPETDSFFRDLFRLGITGPTRLKTFVVISPDELAQERFRDLLGPELKQRFKVRNERFEEALHWLTTIAW